MGNTTNRHAVLGAALAAGAAGAVAALPAVAAASDHPDAALFGLIERAKIAESMADDASSAALIWDESDARYGYGISAGKHISDAEVDCLRHCLKRPTLSLFPMLQFIERAREIVRSKDEFESALQAAKEHPAVLEAKARCEALFEQWEKLARRVATTPSKTPDGLIAKLLMISSGYGEDDLDGSHDGILASAALDARALMNTAREECP
jgi:hypothetical protein